MLEMLEKYSYAITIILLLSSVFSPIIIALINNKHQIKVMQLDMYEEAKRKALSDFIECAQSTIYDYEDSDTLLQYIISFEKLFIYFSGISVESIKPFDHARGKIVTDNSSENIRIANNELNKLVANLSQQIQKK